ncbi:restriction endonuclease subunit S [Myxococcus sp. AS-1-15]|uniref:restriction endonuclease subunit S n=1 Tax=Myxococcus sp. AS-1-15 TaxID=2874600 RepID=UPI001CBEBC7E|nr:restriction endonuclease subunit S [Myxococcus sp. AS-1-15]MBZ4401594.1 restriction endonuclease subunit S [Myxococcus sp. AS-1-15]BDT35542.1 restriction endonuclease subunit S [Myxococcus sp. MH1]
MTKHLPSNWAEALLSEVTEINPPNPSKVPSDSALVSFVPMAAVEEMTGRMDATVAKKWSEVRKGYTRFQEGDVVMAKITPSMENGKAAFARGLIGGIGAGTTEFHVFRPREGVEGRFILHYLLQESFRRQARARMTGTAGQLRVPIQFLEEQQLPLPPTNEQQRIVDAVESYLSRFDAAVASLERVHTKLKAYRASVLNAAVEGRLVPTEAEIARQEGRDYEPAQVLLDRILKERRRRWEEAELARLQKAGKPPKDDKWKAKYEEPAPPDASKAPELPEGWCWVRLEQVTEVQLGQQRAPVHAGAEEQIPYVRAANITWEGLDLSDVKKMGFPNPERYRLRWGDVLLSEASGSPMEAGKPAIWRDEIPGACYQKTLLRVRAIDERALLPEFLRLVFLRDCVTGKFARLAPGVGIVHLTAERMLVWLIPLPPVEEQRRIVEEVERLESVQRVSMKMVADTQRRTVRLRQSILRWAFEGKLVDQNPSDEPAEKLLARIKAERATAAPVKESRARKAKAAS